MQGAYTLNTRNEENNPVLYTYLASFCEHIPLEYVRIHVIYRIDQADRDSYFRGFAPQEYVKLYLLNT